MHRDSDFPYEEIRELFALRISSEATCGDIKHAAEVKLADIEAKIRSLQRIEQALRKLVSACGGRGCDHGMPNYRSAGNEGGE